MSLSALDKKYIWHPFTQEKTAKDNIVITSGKGVWLTTESGDKILDGISSWWTNIFGHSNSYISQALANQANTLEHVIFAGFTHPKAIELSERIVKRLGEEPRKVFFSDNGSTSNEVALKTAFQYWYNQGTPKTKIIAFDGSYHGDTFGVMSTGGRGPFSAPFEPNLFDVDHLTMPNGENDDLIVSEFEAFAESGNVAAFAFEPMIMGTAGMVMYSKSLLQRLFQLCRQYQILTISDEVFSGFYRTGLFMAHFHAEVDPDIICLSKGLTGGYMPLGLTVIKKSIYDVFYDDDKMKALFHGHSYTGNPLSCSVACASLDLYDSDKFKEDLTRICGKMTEFVDELKTMSHFENARCLGSIIAFEVKTDSSNSYFNSIRDQLYDFFLGEKVLLRPLGNTLYIVPPLVISNDELEIAFNAIRKYHCMR